jgi:D-glycero-D-manno-heptose 1,7-bisphosphate phosphatase
MNKAIFLDRDGVLNEEIGNYVCSIEEFTILPGVAGALKAFTEKGYRLIIITNQGGLAKKLYTLSELDRMHEYLRSEMERSGVYFDEIYYCPHHPDYNGKCLCRKPGSVMVEKALARFDIDPALSYFIGDRDRDVQAAEAAGVKGILVESNANLLDLLPLIA